MLEKDFFRNTLKSPGYYSLPHQSVLAASSMTQDLLKKWHATKPHSINYRSCSISSLFTPDTLDTPRSQLYLTMNVFVIGSVGHKLFANVAKSGASAMRGWVGGTRGRARGPIAQTLLASCGGWGDARSGDIRSIIVQASREDGIGVGQELSRPLSSQ